jgi:hypothetical protein
MAFFIYGRNCCQLVLLICPHEFGFCSKLEDILEALEFNLFSVLKLKKKETYLAKKY